MASLVALAAPSSRTKAPSARPSSSGRARPFAAPERHLARLARRRLDDDAVARDLDRAPRRGAEQEGLADAQLVHHLLVELADARPFGAEVHAVEAAVGDGAGVDHGEQARVLARRDLVARAIPDDARPQIGEARPRGSARRACRARRGTARATGPRSCARARRRRRARRPSTAARRPWRRAAARARRAGAAAPRSPRPRRRACGARPPRSRADRRGTWAAWSPCERRPTPWPARPTRCSPRATAPGDSTCTTRSTAPMSMPSSIELVATMPRSWPALSCSSISTRLSRVTRSRGARAPAPRRRAR